MKANELMPGNYLQGEPFTHHRLGLHSDGVTIISSYGIYLIETGKYKVEPIPLTEEWRLKLGFIRTGMSIRLKIGNTGMELCWYDGEDKIRLQTIKSGFTIPIKIKNEVHIIQNLFFSLTNTELMITNKDKLLEFSQTKAKGKLTTEEKRRRKPPEPPLCRTIREGVGYFCKNCGSTMPRSGFLMLFGKRYCDNEKCQNGKPEKN